ncbi:hypothetical protein DPMN_115908 [Dreissena polymorpha]|uniref:Uncharacterized protein n=1 Tax=Dreissena polymorpha TaxID=45954 RepID=A0A9D4KNC9_DREPO|nr:hypothetical protein DPMN_115908 [Dreissena polymorpha]
MLSTNIISMDSAVMECFGPLFHEHSGGRGPTVMINHCVSVGTAKYASLVAYRDLRALHTLLSSFRKPLHTLSPMVLSAR